MRRVSLIVNVAALAAAALTLLGARALPPAPVSYAAFIACGRDPQPCGIRVDGRSVVVLPDRQIAAPGGVKVYFVR